MDNFIPNAINEIDNMLKEAYSLGLSEGTKGKILFKYKKTSRRNF
jgi:hypothetical protein